MFGRKKWFAFIILLLWIVFQQCTVTNDDIIQKQLFDLNWKFSHGNHPTAKEKDFNDIGWRSIDLPHDWSTDSVLIESLKKAEIAGKNTETGWYRKNFEIPENWAGKKIFIELEGIHVQHEIFVNGVAVKNSANGKKHSKINLTHHLDPNENNVIAIRIDVNKESDSTWKAETGIFRHVWLIIKNNGQKP